MLRALKILSVLVVGTALGLFATWATVVRGTMSGNVSSGPWRTSLYTGSSESGPYLRAHIAVHGLLALSREETCIIRQPATAKARRWTATVPTRSRGATRPRAGEHHGLRRRRFLIANAADRYSVSMNSVARRAEGSFAIKLSQGRPRVTGFR